MNDRTWFKCSYCRAMFKSDNNLCISCGAIAEIWKGDEPVLDSSIYSTATMIMPDDKYERFSRDCDYA